eukprot:164267-Alexandrium_andersonii.AAC.1
MLFEVLGPGRARRSGPLGHGHHTQLPAGQPRPPWVPRCPQQHRRDVGCYAVQVFLQEQVSRLQAREAARR